MCFVLYYGKMDYKWTESRVFVYVIFYMFSMEKFQLQAFFDNVQVFVKSKMAPWMTSQAPSSTTTNNSDVFFFLKCKIV